MARRVGLVVAAVAAVAAVALAAVRLGAGGDGDTGGDADPATARSPEAAAGFLAAYERSRTATFVVVQRFTRTAAGGGELTSTRRLVQRPPEDRLLVGGGAAEGRVGGRLVSCTTAAGGEADCVDRGPAPGYGADVAAELADLRRLVDGDAAPYAVTEDGDGCFVLVLAAAFPSPTYGRRARFCFDAGTGAPSLVEIERDEATDRTRTLEVRGTVTDGDLALDDLEPG